LITVEHLKKQYAAHVAVDDISFEVRPREVLGFLGPNGAGKSTTLRILTGYLAASSGRISVDGHDVFQNPEAVKRIVGYLPENVPLYTEMRVDEYLKYRAALKKVPFGKRKKTVDDVVERCRIADVRKRIIGQLSKGYKQRVGIADALVGDPKILILDEPTIGLDPNQIRQTRSLVRELGEERTVILSSHILPEVEAVCSRVLIINKGRIVGQGKPDELRAGMQGGEAHIQVEIKEAPSGVETVLSKIKGVRKVHAAEKTTDDCTSFVISAEADREVRERIFEAAVRSGYKLIGLSSKSASLEDIFVQITTNETSADASRDAAGEGSVLDAEASDKKEGET
jgi:ABC-2 type transport system ATP-binding protein